MLSLLKEQSSSSKYALIVVITSKPYALPTIVLFKSENKLKSDGATSDKQGSKRYPDFLILYITTRDLLT